MIFINIDEFIIFVIIYLKIMLQYKIILQIILYYTF